MDIGAIEVGNNIFCLAAPVEWGVFGAGAEDGGRGEAEPRDGDRRRRRRGRQALHPDADAEICNEGEEGKKDCPRLRDSRNLQGKAYLGHFVNKNVAYWASNKSY